MPIQWGERDNAVIGTLKTFTITPAIPRETLLGSPLTLPTSEPATAQIAFTLQQSDYPTISPFAPMRFNPCIHASGKAGAVVTGSIFYRVSKNGVSIALASLASVAIGNFYGINFWRFLDAQPGDLLEVKLWAPSATDVTLDFWGLIVYPTQPITSRQATLLKDVKFSSWSQGSTNGANTINPSFSTITPSWSQQWSSLFYPDSSGSFSISSFGSPSVGFNYLCPYSTYGLFRDAQGDNSPTAVEIRANATQRQFAKQCFPISFSYREVLR